MVGTVGPLPAAGSGGPPGGEPGACGVGWAVVTPESVFTINRPEVDAEGRIIPETVAAE